MHKQGAAAPARKNISLDKPPGLSPSTGAVNRVNKRFHVGRIGELGDAMPQIEYMACCISVIREFGQHAGGLALNRGRAAKQHVRVEVALQRDFAAHPSLGLGQAEVPVQTQSNRTDISH